MATQKTKSERPKRGSMFVVSHGGYSHDVLVCINTSDADVVAELRTYKSVKLSSDDRDALTDHERGGMDAPATRLGCTVMLDGGQTVIRLRQWRGSIGHLGILAHEVFHAVAMLFDRIGIKLSGDSDEAYAFAIEGLTVSILQQLAMPRSKRNQIGTANAWL